MCSQAPVAEGLAGVPERLDWPADLNAHWRDPTLLISRTCGHPLVTRLQNNVQVIGAVRCTVPGCSGIDYCSEVVVRDDDFARSLDDLRGRVAVVDDSQSRSGCNALRGAVAPLAAGDRFFREWLVSGAHRRSLEWVRDGQADVAAVDRVTLAGLRRQRPGALDGVRRLGRTLSAPACRS